MCMYMYLVLPLFPEYVFLGLISHGSGMLRVQQPCPIQLSSYPALLEVGMQNNYAGFNNGHF